MANDSADFSVRLHDELTGPARAMRAELKGLLGDFKKFDAGAGLRVPRQRREPRATDGLREPKMLTPNDRIRMQERADAAERRARDKAERESARNQKATDRAAAQERRQQERNQKAQERDSAKLRRLMASDEKAKLASVAKQDKAYRAAAVAQQRQMDKVRANEARAQKAQIREQERQEKKVRQAESRRLADMAHDKVLKGGVGAEVKGLMAGSGGGGGLGLSSLLAGGAVAAGIGVILTGLSAVKDAAMAAARAVGNIALSFASASIEALRFQQSSVVALGNLLHAGSDAKKEFDDVRGIAQNLGLDVQDTMHSFQKLLAAQFEVGRAKELIAMGADLQGIGASADEVGRALLAITQIKSKGRLMASEMLQLQEAGISSELVYEALGKRLGKTRNELAKLQEAGKLDAGIGIDAILEAVRKKTGTKEAGELGAKVARSTIDGMLRTLQAGITNMFVDIGRVLEPIVMPIASRVIGLFDVVRNHPKMRMFGDLIVLRLQRVADWTEEHWPQIESILVGGLNMVADAGMALLDVGDWIVDHWGQIEPVLKTVGIMAGIAAFQVGLLAAAVGVALAPILQFYYVLSKVAGAMERIAKIHWGVLSKVPGMQALADRFKDAPQEKVAPDKGSADPGSLRASLDALRTGRASNDNESAWWQKDPAKFNQGLADRQRLSAAAPAGGDYWSAQERVAPVRTPGKNAAQTAAPSMAPITTAAAAQSQAAASTAEAAQALMQSAREISAAARSGGGRSGGESYLAGMLEAI